MFQQFGPQETAIRAVRALKIMLGSGVRPHVRPQTGVIRGHEAADLAYLRTITGSIAGGALASFTGSVTAAADTSVAVSVIGIVTAAGAIAVVQFPFFSFQWQNNAVFLLPVLVGQLRAPRGWIAYDLLRIFRMLRTDVLTHERFGVGAAVAIRAQEEQSFQM